MQHPFRHPPAKLLSFLIWPAFLVVALHYAMELHNGGHPFKTGDWLINYADGLVRRGLVGAMIGILNDYVHSLKWLTYSAQVMFLFFMNYLSHKVYLEREREPEWLIFFLSPAFILFSFYDFNAGFRKEIICFVAFAILAYDYAKRNLSIQSFVLSGLTYALGCFSHEAAIFTLPFFLYILRESYVCHQLSRRTATLAALLYLSIAGASVLFARAFPGGPTTAAVICESAMANGFPKRICDGAIFWIGVDAQHGHQTVLEKLPDYLVRYPGMAALAIFPLFLTAWWKRNMAFLFITAAMISPLFYLATDWGRWINIYIFCLFLLLLAESTQKEIRLPKVPGWGIAAYLILWSIPHYDPKRPHFGLPERIFSIAIELQR